MLQAYLRSKGAMPGSAGYGQKMMQLLQENARGSVDIPSLVNDTPSTDPNVGQQGNVAGKVEAAPTGKGGSLPVPPIPPNTATADTQSQGGGGPPGMDLSNIGALIAAGGGAGLGYWLGGRRGGSPVPGGNVPPPVDPGAGVPALRPNSDVQTGNRFDVLPPGQPADPMQLAMDRAMQPQIGGPAPQLQIGGPAAQAQIGGPAQQRALPAPQDGAIPMPDQSTIPLPDQSTLPRPPMPDRTVPQGMVRFPDGSIGTPMVGGGSTRIGRVIPKPYVPRLMIR
jgi:hypothetical protein